MKKFTKGALIAALVLAILGIGLCVTGAAIGFSFGEFKELVRGKAFLVGSHFWKWSAEDWDVEDWEWNDGEDETERSFWIKKNWTDAQSDQMTVEVSRVKNLELNFRVGEVQITENKNSQNIEVTTTYKKQNHKRQIERGIDGETLRIKENETYSFQHDDEVFINIAIPTGTEFDTVSLLTHAGDLDIVGPLTAEEITLEVKAGECSVSSEIRAHSKLSVSADAGEIDIKKLETGTLELNAGVGEIDIEHTAADWVNAECGIGSIDVTMQGRREDYNYRLKCGLGEIEVAGNTYSGLGATKSVDNNAEKDMDINCGVGEVNIEFLN